MSALRDLLENTTPGKWKVAYWPLPTPHWWIGVHDDNLVSSKMAAQVTGPIANEYDAKLITLAPTLADLLDRAMFLHFDIELRGNGKQQKAVRRLLLDEFHRFEASVLGVGDTPPT